MAHHRIDIRAAARAAVRADARLGTMTYLRAWAQGVDEPTLPVVTVATPRERSGRISKDTLGRYVTLAVIVKRSGGDAIEDELDLDAAAIEAAVMPAIAGICEDIDIDQTEVRMQGDGERRVGIVEVRFECAFYTDTIA